MDLQTEYTSRHKLDIIVGTPGSYLLFKENDKLYVALIGHKPKIWTYCEKCRHNNMAIEILYIDNIGISVEYHDHINPDEDIKQKIKKLFKSKNIEIIRYKNDEQIENLIWQFIGNPGENAQKEIFEYLRKDERKVHHYSQALRIVTFRRHPLVFDEIKDI